MPPTLAIGWVGKCALLLPCAPASRDQGFTGLRTYLSVAIPTLGTGWVVECALHVLSMRSWMSTGLVGLPECCQPHPAIWPVWHVPDT